MNIQFNNAINFYKKLILDELKEQSIECFIAGGCLRDYFHGKNTTNDIDIFFKNKEEYDKAFKYLTKEGKILFQNHNGTKISYNNIKLDIVCSKFFETPQDAIDNFDFTVCAIALDSEKVYHHETTFIDLAKKQLMINKITFPKSTMQRVTKYSRKGFYICNGELSKIFEAMYKEYEELKDISENDDNLLEEIMKKDSDSEQTSSGNTFGGFD